MKKVLLLASVFCSLFALPLVAQEGESVKNSITHGPYLFDMKEDGVTIVWTTRLPSLSKVEIAPSDDLPMYKNERPAFFQSLNGSKLTNRTLHAVRVTGLKPGTNYRYRVFSRDATWLYKTAYVTYGKTVATYESDKYSFTTYSPEKKDVNFLMLNDIHGKSDFMKELCAGVDFKELDFVTFNGDMLNWMVGEEELFQGFMDSAVSLFATRVPLMYPRGNHETRGIFAHKFTDYYPTTTGKIYQVYYHGGICFLVLDGGEDKPDSDIEYSETSDYDAYREEQAKWLAEVVETPEYKNARARIAFLHIPPTIGNWHGNMHLRQTLMPILNKANVDVMLSGHTHRYSYHEPNEGAAFPILVNGNKTYLKGSVTDDEIKLNVIGLDASEAKEIKLKLKK